MAECRIAPISCGFVRWQQPASIVLTILGGEVHFAFMVGPVPVVAHGQLTSQQAEALADELRALARQARGVPPLGCPGWTWVGEQILIEREG